MKKLWIGIFCIVALIGCTKSQVSGWKISIATCIEKIKQEESFVLVINQKSNHEGMIFQRTLEPFMREHNDLPIYEVVLDEQGEKKQDTYLALNQITEHIKTFEGTLPTMLYFEDGEVVKQVDGALSEIAWSNFLKEVGVLKGEIEEEEPMQSTDSEMFITDTRLLYEEWKKGSEVYIFAHEQDSYSMKFSNTLKKQVEEREQSIYLLNVNDPSLYTDSEMREMLNTLSIYMTPTLLQVQNKEVVKRLEDNASEEELNNWF